LLTLILRLQATIRLRIYLIKIMPVEIREIVIKTVIQSGNSDKTNLSSEALAGIRKDIMEECKRMINENSKKPRIKR